MKERVSHKLMENIQTSGGQIPKLSEWVEQVVPAETVMPPPPMPPSVLSALFKNSEDRSLDETVSVVENDEMTTARILLWANSASSGAVERITDLKTAIMRVGVGSMVQITLLSKFKSFLSIPLGGYGVKGEEFWMHGFATAIAAESMEVDLTIPVPHECFVAGLLHDIGKVFIDRYVEQFSLNRMEGGEVDHYQLEIDTFGLDHASIGGSVVRHWGFDPVVVDCVAHHHDFGNERPPEVKVLQLANQIAKSIGRKGGAGLPDQEVSQLLRELGLNKNDFEKIRNRSRSKLSKFAGTLK